MKVYQTKSIEVRVQGDSGKVQIHLNSKGDAFLTLKQFGTLVRRVIAADRKRAAKLIRESR